MSDTKRPDGLTALAVLNFIFVAFGGLGLHALWTRYSLVPATPDAAIMSYSLTQEDGRMIIIAGVVLLVSMTLLIVSGFGYLGRKKLLGRHFGSIYGIVSICGTIAGLVFAKTGFGIGAVIGLIYPLVTLALVNTKFRKDFINP